MSVGGQDSRGRSSKKQRLPIATKVLVNVKLTVYPIWCRNCCLRWRHQRLCNSNSLQATLSQMLTTTTEQVQPGMEKIAIFSKYGKYRTFSIFFIFLIHIGYFQYFHLTAQDWVMSIERLMYKLYISEWGYSTKNNNNSNTALCTMCIVR